MSKPLKEVNSQMKDSTKEFSVDKLNKALFDFEDLMERCLSSFLVLGQTAWDISTGLGLTGDKVEVGIQTKYLTPEVLSTIKTYKGIDLDKDMGLWEYEVDGVPVRVKLIKRKYKFFANPEMKFYWGGDYQLPNPMGDYWKSRFIVR